MNSKTQRRLNRLYGGREPAAKCFVPSGRSGYYLYAVSLHEHANVVKVGRTKSWSARKSQYENWNLSDGDAIKDLRVFTITDEFVDLPALERHVLASIGLPLRHGEEWFHAEFEDVCRKIDSILCESGITYL